MKKAFWIISILLCLLVGCAERSQNERNIADYYTLTQNGDHTYTYRVSDINGNLLLEKESAVRAPEVQTLSPSVYGFVTQAGTGLSTNWAVYCDVELGCVSEQFNYVLMAQDNFVVYAEREENRCTVTVQNIFDKNDYCKQYELENVSSVAADFIVACTINGEGELVITYLSGENYTETERIIQFP